MSRKDYNIDELLSLEEKNSIIEEYGQTDLAKLFKDYRPNYKPLYQKSNPLDQKIAVGITGEEKELITNELYQIRRHDSKTSLSSVVRSRATGDIDIMTWRERAVIGLQELSRDEYNRVEVRKNVKKYLTLFDNAEDEEDEYSHNLSLIHWQNALEELSRPTERRGFRMSGRVTFNEANHIRWRAGRLTLTVADYMRFLIFGYEPFTDGDRHMSIDARRRFYISIIDVADNGWRDAPQIEECPNCTRYAKENKELQDKLRRISELRF